MDNLDENVRVKVYFKNKGNLIANATVYLNTVQFGILALKGFQIWSSQRLNERLGKNINISPPTKTIYGKSIYLLYFENPEGWYKLEQTIFEAFVSEETNQTI